MRNPLYKRIPRELRSDAPKYFVIFLLLTLTIGLVSGFLVSDESMIKAYDESFETYHIEDGHFITTAPLNRAQRKRIENAGVSLYDMQYFDRELDSGAKMRFYASRTEVNLACVMHGRLPEATGEIAIDRMFADNNKLKVGDTLQSNGRTWTISGLVALSDYSSLFENNGDTMFDALTFSVGVVTETEFSQIAKTTVNCYAWTYDTAPVGEKQEQDASEDLLKEVNKVVSLEEWIPRYINQAIIFTGDDMGSDKVMMQLLLYILIVIIAFVFAVTISNTILKESVIIGTLRASGYTRMELLKHYLVLPITVTLVGAIIGNILGYTYFKDFCAGLYYNSYSLPTYVTIWNMNAFIETTVIPVILMMMINVGILYRKLSLAPLKFIRRDLTRKKKQKTIRLNPRLPFMTRFRLRIFLQNAGNFAVLFLGIMFANILLLFGLGMPDMLDNFQHALETNQLSDYQYILKIPPSALNEDRKLESLINMAIYATKVETKNKTAEKFSAYSLKTLGDEARQEDIALYGVKKNSRYVDIGEEMEGVFISATFAEKYDRKAGDTITLKEAYEDTTYTFKIVGVHPYEGSLCLFMNQSTLNKTFDLGDSFSGYFSSVPLTDIDEKYIGSVIDFNALTKVSRQLDHSMGDMMYLVDVCAVVIFMIVIYLLSKTIIEKNAQSISLTKILGYNSAEISRLYIVSISVVTIASLAISVPLSFALLKPIFMAMMKEEMTGWISFNIRLSVFIKTFLFGVVTYVAVAVLEYRRVKHVPMDEALKNVE